MLRKTSILTCTALLLSLPLTANAIPATGKSNKLEWKVVENVQLSGKPLDFAQSLDGKLTYVLDDQHNVVVYDYNGDKLGSIPAGAGVTSIDISATGDWLYLVDTTANTFTRVNLNFVQEIDIAGSPFKGDAAAPVTIVVFTDFECPYCIKLEPVLNEVYEANKDQVKVVFKNMPLSFHKMADPSHRAAMAADMQGKFWEFHDRLFTAPKLSNQLITDIATELGLDMEKFKKDMNSSLVRQKVQKDIGDAKRAEVTGTPTVFINGRRVSDRSQQAFQNMINEELAAKK